MIFLRKLLQGDIRVNITKFIYFHYLFEYTYILTLVLDTLMYKKYVKINQSIHLVFRQYLYLYIYL